MTKPNLEKIVIAEPCSASWDEMDGDEKVRLCQLCSKNVYNISAMSRAEAEQLFNVGSGKLPCIRVFRRQDGTIMTDNCPRPLRKLRDGCRLVGKVVASLVFLFLSVSSTWAQNSTSEKNNTRSQSTAASADSRCNDKGAGGRKDGSTPTPMLMGAPLPPEPHKTNNQKLPAVKMGEPLMMPALPADTAQALETLKNATSIDDWQIGYAGRTTSTVVAYRTLTVGGPSIVPQLQEIVNHGSPAGRVYAALLLGIFDDQLGKTALNKLTCSDDKTTYRSGCKVESVAVKELAKRALKGDKLITLPKQQ